MSEIDHLRAIRGEEAWEVDRLPVELRDRARSGTLGLIKLVGVAPSSWARHMVDAPRGRVVGGPRWLQCCTCETHGVRCNLALDAEDLLCLFCREICKERAL